MNSLIAVIGDVHHKLWLALDELKRIEQSLGRGIDQVFSVGDLGLFLEEDDWRFLTGPSRYKCPEDSPRIRQAWEHWRWPLSMIAGNHEPFHRLRDWDPDYFGGKLDYVDAGVMAHAIPGLLVYGLSGIFHPEEFEAMPEGRKQRSRRSHRASWSELVDQVCMNEISPRALTHYKQDEVDLLLNLPPKPHLLLTHDWPTQPAHLLSENSRRSEADLVELLQPQFACCGHHHTASAFELPPTQVRALNILSRSSAPNSINAGWCLLLEWDGMKLVEREFAQPE